MNESEYKNEAHFTKPVSSFAFGSNDENEDEKKDYDDGVDENLQPIYHKSLDLAVRLKALNEGFQFLADKSAPGRYELKCYHYNECAWKLRARLWDNTDKFYVTYLNDVHTCPKLKHILIIEVKKTVVAHIITPKLQDSKRLLKGKDIKQDILSEYKVNISYQQAWRGKDYGIQQIRGSPYESFEMLPYYCHNLERKNQRTITRVKTDEKGVFEMLFIAIGASIRTFLNCLRPLLIIDAAHLKGLYKGTNLVAMGMDGNNHIVPIAFGICKGETGLVPLADVIQERDMILTYTQTHQNRLHVYVSRVELSPLVVAEQHKDETNKMGNQVKPICAKDRFTNRRPEINRLNSLPDDPLIEYGRYALRCMTEVDMKKAAYLKMARDELLRCMEEKCQLIKNYKEI
ncbi:hypothetical protein Tco_0128559 [Tanacetum coccineum]